MCGGGGFGGGAKFFTALSGLNYIGNHFVQRPKQHTDLW